MRRTPGTGGLFKRKVKRPDGTYGKDKHWTIWYVDAYGRRRQIKGFRDKRATGEKFRTIRNQVEAQCSGRAAPDQEALKQPIAEHIEAFLRGKESDGNTRLEINRKRARLIRVVTGSGIATFPDLTEQKVKEFLLVEKQSEGLAKKTRNEYRSLLKAFSAWAARTYHWPDPLVSLQREKGEDGQTFRRCALTEEQLVALLRAARDRGVAQYRETHPNAKPKALRRVARHGLARELVYRIGATLGLRGKEMQTLVWGDLRLNATGICTCTISAKHAKSRREDTVPINSGLVAALLEWRRIRTKELGRAPKATERVVPVSRHLPYEQFRKDRAYAGIPRRNENGDILDFYAATRHTFCTLLGRQDISPHKMRLLMRHRDLRTTLRYTHLETEDLVVASESLPQLPVFGAGTSADILPTRKTDSLQDGSSEDNAPQMAQAQEKEV